MGHMYVLTEAKFYYIQHTKVVEQCNDSNHSLSPNCSSAIFNALKATIFHQPMANKYRILLVLNQINKWQFLTLSHVASTKFNISASNDIKRKTSVHAV